MPKVVAKSPAKRETSDVEEENAIAEMDKLRSKKTYTFGRWKDATIVTFYDTKRVFLIRKDPAGQHPPHEMWVEDYAKAAGMARFFVARMNAKFGNR